MYRTRVFDDCHKKDYKYEKREIDKSPTDILNRSIQNYEQRKKGVEKNEKEIERVKR